jgi:hypothetical protein
MNGELSGERSFFFFFPLRNIGPRFPFFFLLPYLVHQQPCRKYCNGRLKYERLSSSFRVSYVLVY